jgi:hypothetical protein
MNVSEINSSINVYYNPLASKQNMEKLSASILIHGHTIAGGTTLVAGPAFLLCLAGLGGPCAACITACTATVASPL